MFLKLSPNNATPLRVAANEVVCAALRVAWLPDKEDPSRSITADSVLLAEQGFDFGWWDSLPTQPSRGLLEADRETFYHLLGALASLPPSTPRLKSAPPIDIAAAIRTPDSQRGALVTVEGTVYRIDKVEANDSEMQARFGLTHYYTLFVFVPLGNLRIRLASHEKSRLFENQFPVTVCVPELPAGLTPGPVLHEHVELQGGYYRVWNYQPSGSDQELLQPSPLVIAPAVRLVEREAADNSDATLGIVFVGLLGAIVIFAWWFSRGNA